MLVSYSDSEGSEDETPKTQPQKTVAKPAVATTSSNSSFAIDRSTGKIKVNLQNKPDPSSNDSHEDEPAAKRPRIGGSGRGAFSGFNAMLPAPKRDNLPATQSGTNKAPAPKVFSLRTGAEPAFSRESDAELRNFFADQDVKGNTEEIKSAPTIPTNIPKPSFAKPAPPAPAGKAFMFKPLSVARNTKKKKMAGISTASTTSATVGNPQPSAKPTVERVTAPDDPPKKKINLFSAGVDTTTSASTTADFQDDDEIIEDLGPATTELEPDDELSTFQPGNVPPRPQSLNTIANDLNLTAAERRQLFGRNGTTANAVNVVNFNTDAEYAANQQLIAAGEQVQHNPVRAIASGKHSLRQLVSSAADQKEALEESFASGRRNKKEAGSKYGW